MIVQLLGGIFDGAETEVTDTTQDIAFKIQDFRSGPPRYAVYERHPRNHSRYRFKLIQPETELNVKKSLPKKMK